MTLSHFAMFLEADSGSMETKRSFIFRLVCATAAIFSLAGFANATQMESQDQAPSPCSVESKNQYYQDFQASYEGENKDQAKALNAANKYLACPVDSSDRVEVLANLNLAVGRMLSSKGSYREATPYFIRAASYDSPVKTAPQTYADLAKAYERFHNERVVNVRVRRLQCDEIWSFVGSKERHTTAEQKAQGRGDAWTWLALDSETKLCVSFLVGGRDASWARLFMEDCARRIVGRVQVTTDGHKAYLEAVEGAFGMDCDYAMLIKQYGLPTEEEARRYSPARCIGCDQKVVSGNPDPQYINTSHIERFNLTMRMTNRRFTRLTNAFSKKLRNHELMIAVHTVHYNFVRMHKSLRCSPAMAADLSRTLWSLEDMIDMVDSYMPKPSKRGPYKKNRA